MPFGEIFYFTGIFSFSDPDLEEFFNNLCKEKFGKSYASGSNQGGGQQMPDTRKRKGKKKK